MIYALNVSSVDHCRPCDDTGWVELIGTVKQHGYSYSRGTAPCKWCEAGKRRYSRMLELRQPIESDFSLEEVDYHDDDRRPVSKQQAKAYIETIQAQWSRPRNDELAMRPESRAETEAKRELARKALEAGEGTVELPAERPQLPVQPDYDDIPF